MPNMVIAPQSAGASGFVILDSEMDVVVANSMALEILAYPDKPDATKRFSDTLAVRVRTALVARYSSGGSYLASEFHSGRRLYSCRAFPVGADIKGEKRGWTAVLFERGGGASQPYSVFLAVSRKYRFTSREHQVLRFLLEGLTSKQIADRMNISPNTVKGFLRLIMVKMGVSTRSGIVGKAMTAHEPPQEHR
jgi:DNA-binding CsgD family transcriptional regulator